MREPGFCLVGDCEEPTRRGRTFCGAHEKRLQRGQPLLGEVQRRLDAKARLLEAALKWMDAPAEDDAEYRAREKEMIGAAVRYVRELDRQREAGEVAAGAPS